METARLKTASSKKRSRPGGRRSAARFDSLEQEVFLSLWRTYDRLKMHEDLLFEQFNLTPQLYNIMRLLLASFPEPLPTLQLAARLVTHAPDITRMIDRLVDRKLVERERQDANRRIVLVRITADGRRLLEQIAKPLEECHARQLGHLSKGDLARLSDLLAAARAPHEEPGSAWL